MSKKTQNTEKEADKALSLGGVSGIVHILEEGNMNFHLESGTIEHSYFIDEKREYARCNCGRLLHYR